MLIDRVKTLENEVEFLKENFAAIPTWIPLTLEFAKDCKYKTLDGLRRWCYKNLSPDEFVKKDRFWFIHKKALAKTKQKRV